MKIIFFGIGYCFSQLYDGLKKMERIVGLIDNDEKKQGNVIDGLIIDKVENIEKYKYDLIILCGLSCDGMRKQLSALGVSNRRINTYKEFFLYRGKKYNDEYGEALGKNFDVDFFKKCHVEFQRMSDVSAINYFLENGEKYGLVGAEIGLREGLIDVVESLRKGGGNILEIGPFDNPQCSGEGVKYFDIYDSDRLKEEAIKRGRNNSGVPKKIDYVSENGDLSIIDEKFDVIFSSHCIEHQPNLIMHFMQIERLLKDNGYYTMIIPDKRFSFDYYAPISSVENIIEDFENNKRMHSLADVLSMSFFRTHNDPMLHWKGVHGEQFGIRRNRLEESAYVDIDGDKFYDNGSYGVSRITELINSYNKAIQKGVYIDAHCNRFTPQNFRYIVNMLKELGYIQMDLVCIHNTPFGRQEFCAVIQKSGKGNDSLGE